MKTNDNIQDNGGNEEKEQPAQEKIYLFFIIAAVCCGIGALALLLAFLIPNAGVYMLVVCILCELASLAFLNNQKKRYNFKLCLIVRIVSYAVLLAALVIFIIGAAIASK